MDRAFPPGREVIPRWMKQLKDQIRAVRDSGDPYHGPLLATTEADLAELEGRYELTPPVKPTPVELVESGSVRAQAVMLAGWLDRRFVAIEAAILAPSPAE